MEIVISLWTLYITTEAPPSRWPAVTGLDVRVGCAQGGPIVLAPEMQSGVQALRAPGAGMASWWRVFPRAARRYPWPTNVLLYAGLYSAGDALQQRLRGGPADWRQTRRVATLAVTFHGNFNYVWLRLLERALPGRAPRTVLAKVLCDQTVGGPVALSAFYVGEGPESGTGDQAGGSGVGVGAGNREAGDLKPLGLRQEVTTLRSGN